MSGLFLPCLRQDTHQLRHFATTASLAKGVLHRSRPERGAHDGGFTTGQGEHLILVTEDKLISFS